MKGKGKLIYIVPLCALLIIGWTLVLKEVTGRPAKYNALLADAQYQEDVNVFKRAVVDYAECLKIYDKDINIHLKMANDLLKINNPSDFISKCNGIIELFPKDERAYILEANYYLKQNQFTQLINVLKQAKQNVPSSKTIQQLYDDNAFRFDYLMGKYDEALPFDSGYSAVKVGNKWGFAQMNGDLCLKPEFDYAASFLTNNLAAVKLNGEYYFIDTMGDRALATKEKYEALFSFSQGLAPAAQNGKYGYVQSDFKKGNFQWDYASNYLDSIAAVKKDGKWGLIDLNGKFITGLDYDDIKLDKDNLSFVNGVAFAKQNGKYVMLNSKGDKIGSTSFDDAKVFFSKEYAAVKVGDKWGYVNEKGEIKINPQFEDAQSFSIGLGAVKVNGKWGYINYNGKIVIDCQFNDAMPFSNKGIAVVKDSDKYRFIQLYSYKD